MAGDEVEEEEGEEEDLDDAQWRKERAAREKFLEESVSLI